MIAVILPSNLGDDDSTRRGTAVRSLLSNRLYTALGITLCLMFLGAVGYWVLGNLHAAGVLEPRLEEPWSVVECIYMTVITVATIGYGESLPLPAGTAPEQFVALRLYTISLILVAMLIMAYTLSSATAFLANGDLQRQWLRRRSMKKIAQLNGHYIVCGLGVTGRVILDELAATSQAVVAIDLDEDQLAEFQGTGEVFPLTGDATADATLRDAGIERAAGLAAALPSDKDNLFLIITARQLCPTIRVVSLASEHQLSQKLCLAGADVVVASSFIGGLRMASELLRPAVVSFLDEMLRGKESPVRFAEIHVGQEWRGKTLREVDVPGSTGLPVLAVKPRGQEFQFNPPPEHVLEEGAVLVTMGEVSRVDHLEQISGGGRAHAELIGRGDGESPSKPGAERTGQNGGD